MFTDREIEVVRGTWAKASADPDAAAALFYGKLFETAPAVKPLFTADMKDQGRKLMQMIGIAVNNIDSSTAKIAQIIHRVVMGRCSPPGTGGLLQPAIAHKRRPTSAGSQDGEESGMMDA